jgi:hypothetical protein
MLPVDYRNAMSEADATALKHASSLLDSARFEMEGTMGNVRRRSEIYMNWYSPRFDPTYGIHDAWYDPITDEDYNRARSNLTLSRAVVDIWAAIEAASGVMIRADPESLPPMPPSLDQGEAMQMRMEYDYERSLESIKADIRSRRMRTFMRRDDFDAKQFYATRKKNLHGFSWMKVLPDGVRKNPRSWVPRNPTNIFPWWSSDTPGDVDVLVSAQMMGARKANQKYDLGLEFVEGTSKVKFGRDGLPQGFAHGQDAADYRSNLDMSFDKSRTMVWVEELWWVDRTWGERNGMDPTMSCVFCFTRVAGRPMKLYTYPRWRHIPWVFWQNGDEREEWGWSDVANVMDLNDSLNRIVSQQQDVIGAYSSTRFQVLGTVWGRDISMPGPFQKVDLQDAERIEQILTRIDTYPTDRHFDMAMDLLHRTTGLPPIVWGLINNAQTSGRALSASWKATETRLASRLIDNKGSVSRYTAISEDYATVYDWYGGARVFTNNEGDRFEDWRYTFPPMEPRDFMEVTQNAITKRNEGLITSIQAMRETGDENAEDTNQEVLTELQNIFRNPEKVQAFLLAQQAQLNNMQMAQQLQAQGAAPPPGQPTNTATVAQAVGQARQAQISAEAGGGPQGVEEGTLPPTVAGDVANPGLTAPAGGPRTSTGTMLQNGEVSNRILQQGQL